MSSGRDGAEHSISVVFFDPFGVAGLTHYTYCLGQALASIGVRPTLLTSRNYELDSLDHHFQVESILPMWNPFSPSPRPRLLVRMEKGGRYLLSLALATVYMIRRKPDICHLMEMHFSLDIAFLLVLKLLGIGLVNTCHNVQRFDIRSGSPGVVGRGKVSSLIHSLMYRCFDGLIFHTSEHRDEFRTVFGFLPPYYRTIPHGDYFFVVPQGTKSKAEARGRLNIPPKKRLVLFFGILRKYKGLETLIQAFPKVERMIPDALLLIAGAPFQDTDLDGLKALAVGTGCERQIIWHEHYIPLEDVADYFTACDVVVLPYSKIYQSGVLRLAQAFAKPVVATGVGDLPNTLQEGEMGLLAPPGDPQALARALVEMLSHPEQARIMGARGRKLSRATDSWTPIALETKELYREILEGT